MSPNVSFHVERATVLLATSSSKSPKSVQSLSTTDLRAWGGRQMLPRGKIEGGESLSLNPHADIR